MVIMGSSVKAWGIVGFDFDRNGLLNVMIRVSIGLFRILFKVGIAFVGIVIGVGHGTG